VSLFFALSLVLASCTATDGDTIRCGDERIRLTGIDAPELGRCQPRRRRCVSGDGAASRRALQAAMAKGELRIVRLGRDRYGRTLAVVFAGKANLACSQLGSRQAVYRRDWDDRAMVAHDCPKLAR
jgi:micrococcal nuclease